MSEWQDISTAPKDRSVILVWVPTHNYVGEAYWCEETGLWPREADYSDEGEPCNVGLPTHWMPLPDPPQWPPNNAIRAPQEPSE